MKSTEIRIRKIKEELLGQATECFGPRYGGSRMNRADVLDAVKKTICEDRQDTHGNPESTHELIGGFWSDYIRSRGWSCENGDNMITAQDAAVMMALMKIARHSVNPKHADSLHDAIGYAAIAAELGQ